MLKKWKNDEVEKSVLNNKDTILKEQFGEFLKQLFPEKAADLLSGFELYQDELYVLNQQVNLVSRQMSKEDYWLYHFLDSLLIIKCVEISSGDVLDFGSGGGLPGIPLKLVFPELKMTLLDSVGKKVKCLEQMISRLQLRDCRAVWSRLEDYATSLPAKSYDYILCRSVRLEPGFIEPLNRLLKPNGKAIFYKAHQIEDVVLLPEIEICDVSRSDLGKRQIVIAPKRSFEIFLNNRNFG